MNFFENARQAKLVRHLEKQENIARFVGYYLDRTSVSDSTDGRVRHGTLIARSPSSPVARALLSAANELKSLHISLEVAFARLEPAELMADWVTLSRAEPGRHPIVRLRWAARSPLHEAHEQMVLGLNMTWTGDCMRREPETRDAYEMFDTFHVEAAKRSTQSFRAIWNVCQPVPVAILGAATESTEGLPETGPTSGLAEVAALPPKPSILTRH
ncbi:MAG: hypothetical protein R3D57_18415 [Hyphomicrobiaceae bacterium]